MPAKLGRDNWVATYQENVQPVDLAIISAQAIGGVKISPPKYRPPKGRPVKKRLRKGDVRKRVLVQNVEDLEEQLAERPSHCHNCGEPGHNRRTCKRAPLE